MKHLAPSLTTLFAIAILASGCASTAKTPTASTAPDCRQLSSEIARNEEARRVALEKERQAWKAVIPFAVAVRYVDGKSSAAEANQRLATLRAQFIQHGCSRDAG